MELSAGNRIGTSPWVIVRPLGKGAFGEVVEVEHEITHKRGACKVLKPVAAGTKGDVIRDKTLEAARLLARAEHPNLVDVYDGGYLDTTPPRNWVVMELLGAHLPLLHRRRQRRHQAEPATHPARRALEAKGELAPAPTSPLGQL